MPCLYPRSHARTIDTMNSDNQNPEESPLEQQPHGHIKSFVRRLGRFTDAQRSAYEALMPVYGVAYQNQITSRADWAKIFGNDNPIVLEIGCGMGETTAKIAAQNPHINYIGVEVFTSGVGALLKRITEYGLSNLRVMQHDAVEIIRDMIPHGTLDGIHIYFPDPWHKARHHKRRLIQSPFVHELALRLKPDAYIHCATDWENYAEQMLEVLSTEALLHNTSPSQTYIPRPEYRPLTKYENRGNRLGHGVWDLIFVKK